MKRWINKLKMPIHSNKGETLVESIVSIFIFIICILVVSTMLTTSLTITRTSTQNAARLQDKIITPAMLSQFDDSRIVSITFYSEGISSTHYVKVNETDGIIAFAPEEGNEF